MPRHALVGASLALIAFAAPGAANQDVLQQTAKPEQWALQTGDYANQRYSKLNQITRDNVKNLKVAWTFSTGVLRGHEGSPLVIGDIMYVHTPFPNIVYALDLNEDGKILWKYEPKQDPSVIPVMCCDTVYRGVAYADNTIYLHQADTTVVALDAKTGKEKWKAVNGDPKKGETNTATVLAGEGQGDRRHLRRRVRRARPRHRLRRQDRQAAVARLLDGARRRDARRPGEDHVARQADRQGLLAQDLERRPVEDRRRHELGLVLLRSGHQPLLLRHRQPLDLEPDAARRPGRQADRPEMDHVHLRPRCRHRHGQVDLSDDAVRRVGL